MLNRYQEIEKHILEFIALAHARNDNRKPCCCNVRAAGGEKVNQLLAELTSVKARGRTWEGPGRVIVHPAPYQRAALSRAK